MKTYLVGGAIRDQLLGLNPTERDWLVVGATVADMDALGYRTVGSDFPVFLHPQTNEEYALARTERKSGIGHKGFTFHTSALITVDEDLFRRDLTINAIAQDLNTQQLIDPYNGQADIKAKLLRHVSPAFSEDPLRVLRVARFAAKLHHLGFTVHASTLQLMSDIAASGELTTLSPERVWREMNKALHTATPAVFFEVLQGCGALTEINKNLALLFSNTTSPSNSDTINSTPADTSSALRYAQLWHGAQTVQLADTAILKASNEALKAPKYPRQLATAVALYQHLFHDAHNLSARQLFDLFSALGSWRNPQLTEDFATVCAVRGNAKNNALLQRCYSAAAQINTANLVAQGYAGKALGTAIEQERINRIEITLNGDDAPLN